MIVGRVAQLWRHPVKSMGGERLGHVSVDPAHGIAGDRGWALRDEDAGEIRGARRMPALVRCHARYLREPVGAATPPVEITFPDGVRRTSDHPGVEAALSALVGRQVTLWPRRPASDRDHHRRARAMGEDEIREILGLAPDEALPDFSGFSEQARASSQAYAVTPGTYFDSFPLSLLTTTAMASLSACSPGSVIDPRRFRQNVIVEGAPEVDGFPEFGWAGRRLRIGSVPVTVATGIPRCVMVTHEQAELPRDRGILRALKQATGMRLGVYLQIDGPGEIAEGDEVELV